MKKVILLMALMISQFTFADETINQIEISDNVVYFTTTQVKKGERPACMASENTNYWTISLQDTAGRALYSLLVTALADDNSVLVESANNCNAKTDYEAVKGLVIDQPNSAASSEYFKVAAMGKEGPGYCQTTLSASNNQGQSYLYTLNGQCQCRDSSTLAKVPLVKGGSTYKVTCFIKES